MIRRIQVSLNCVFGKARKDLKTCSAGPRIRRDSVICLNIQTRLQLEAGMKEYASCALSMIPKLDLVKIILIKSRKSFP